LVRKVQQAHKGQQAHKDQWGQLVHKGLQVLTVLTEPLAQQGKGCKAMQDCLDKWDRKDRRV
jgi:hypothetical protein